MDRIFLSSLLLILPAQNCRGNDELTEVCLSLLGKVDMMSKEMNALRSEVMDTKTSLEMTQKALAMTENKITEMMSGSNNPVAEMNQKTGKTDDASENKLLITFEDEVRLSRPRRENIQRLLSALPKASKRTRHEALSRQTHTSLLNEIIAVLQRFSVFDKPRSCLDIYRTDKTVRSGVYIIYTTRNDSLEVFCQFDCNSGYMFLSSNSLKTLQSADLPSGSFDHVVLRHQRNDGSQFESRMEQISRYRHLPLSFQVNEFVGYNAFNNKNMGPYLYLGFTPKSNVSRGDVEGYSVFGHEIKFSNCDGNPNSYFVFLFNHNNASFTSKRHPPTPISRQWINKSKPVPPSAYLPCGYFSSFEIHFGGCGAYATNQLMDDVSGAALGLPFSY